MKKFFSLVLALVMALSLTTVAWGAEYSVASGDITIAVDASGVQTVNGTEDAAPVITGTDAAKVITVTTAAGQTANFTIKDLTAKRIVIKDSSATITLEGANVIGGDSWKPAIHVTSGTLTIKGAGALKAESNWAAAIGSSQGSSSDPEDMSGTINIEGGTITAKGGYGAAIGAGQYGEMTGAINITGGTVNATGGHGAAIGGSQYGDMTGTVDISAGNVTAKATIGAAIGTGSGDLTSAAKINISGGTVSATADKGAGIGVGGGYISSGSGSELAGTINVTGGDVTATSTDGAGIGAGGGNVDAAATGSSISGSINISAGTVEASSTNGAGIGTGGGNVVSGGAVQPSAPPVTEITGTINVSGGDVTASSTNANAVGGGSYGDVDSSADVSLSTGDYSGGDVEDYVAPGSTVVSNGNTVVKNLNGSVAVNPVAQIGNTKYSTVADAVAAAGANDVIVLLDASATIPTGYTVATDLNGNPVVLAGTSAPASAAKGAYYTTNLTTLATYPSCDLSTYTYTLEPYTAAADTAKIFATVAIWQTHKITGAKTIVDTAVVASADSANLAFVNGASVTYLNTNVAKWTATATPVATVDVEDAEKCGDVFAAGDVGVYTDAAGKVYYETTAAGAAAYNVGGQLVMLKEAAKAYPVVDSADLKAAKASPAAGTVYTVAHDYDWDVKTVGSDYTVTRVFCAECKGEFAFVVGDTTDAIKKFGAGNYGVAGVVGPTNDQETIYVSLVPAAGTVATPSTDKVVQSAETFDAGIAMYVGMSVMAAAGSAVVIGKKKD